MAVLRRRHCGGPLGGAPMLTDRDLRRLNDSLSSNRASRTRNRAPSLFVGLLILAETVLCASVLFELWLPVRLLIIFMAVITVAAARTLGPSPLAKVLLVLYVLPFTALLGLLLDPEYLWWRSPRALPFVSQRPLLQHMLSVGLIGLVGYIIGVKIMRSKSTVPASWTRAPISSGTYMTLGIFALGLTWLGSPSETIREASYATVQSDTVGSSFGIQAAPLVGYIIIMAMWLDRERDGRADRRRLKAIVLASVTIIVVGYIQLFHGNRDSAGLLVGFGFLWLTSGLPRKRLSMAVHRLRRLRSRAVAVGLIVVLPSFLLVGSIRNTWAQKNQIDIVHALSDGYRQATWSSVLLTNLSVARRAMLDSNGMSYLGGSTYVDYARSAIPGIAAAALNISRPINETEGPAWIVHDLSAGGIHVALVPFLNFGVFGLIIVMLAIGWAVRRLDVRALAGRGQSRYWGAVVAVASPRWIWYGDMVLVRALMGGVLVLWLYKAIGRMERTFSGAR